MRPFEILEPSNLKEAVSLLDAEDDGVRAIAGGTALMLMMKTRLFQPTRLISLRRLDGGLRGVYSEQDGGLRIGAMTTLTEMERSPLLAGSVPIMGQALRDLANVRIRNVATLGGSLAHGDPHMDLPPVLVALGARVHAVSSSGERWIDIGDFFTGYYQTALAREELVSEVVIPAQSANVRACYTKYTLTADDWPTVGVAAWCRLESATIAEARVVVSAATECPVRILEAERILTGARPSARVFAEAADAATQEIQPLADIRGSASYKSEMVRVHVRRALERALQSDTSEA